MENSVASYNYQICTQCIMDTTDPEITFDQNGVCNHCHSYVSIEKDWNLEQHIQNKTLENIFDRIKRDGKNKKYDCIMGLSGGVDSSYIALLVKKYGLRPLAIHLDNGWNSELSVHNIHKIVETLKIDLYTHVIDWDEFRELQLAFFRANVVDIELLSDHAIFSVIMQKASEEGIKYIISGVNTATESIMPNKWVHRKTDSTNIVHINKLFGTQKIKTYPLGGTFYMARKRFFEKYVNVRPLNYIQYNKEEALQTLERELGWRRYPGKHYESLFTKFYQAHILPTKFNIDKRKAHYSSLICSGQMTREEAVEKMKAPLYDPKELAQDKEFVLKKLQMNADDFEKYLKTPAISHYEYKTDELTFKFLSKVRQAINFRLELRK